MDEEMEKFVRETYGDEEIDMDYEFDAPKFYDFTRPESDSEAEEAEDWFRFAGSYPPSPFIIKLLNWQSGVRVEYLKTSAESEDVEEIRHISNDSYNCMEEAEVSVAVDDYDREFYEHMAQDTPNPKPKSPDKSPPLSRTTSTLMKPTASQLAKQNHRRDTHSNRLLRRFGKKLGKFDEKYRKSPSIDSVTTKSKRQKLEAGYIRKAAELKHQPLWSHKVPKKVGGDTARHKVTIPREPNLETAHRAQRRRYKVNAKPGEQSKIHKAPPFPTPKKSNVPTTEFQVFHLRTSARAMKQTVNNVTNTPNSGYLSQNETTEIQGPNYINSLRREKGEMVYKCIACSLKMKSLPSKGETGIFSNIKQDSRTARELKFSIDEKFLKEPPTDLFSKLSLASEAQHKAKPQSKSAFAC